MTILKAVTVFAALVFAPAAAAADDTASRAKAADEAREAFDAYREVLENEIERLQSWTRSIAPPGGESLREERETAKRALQQLAEEAKGMWSSLQTRMDNVVDDVKRRHGDARATPSR